ncbi:MAG: helix-turn-helix transcriptional regulator [Oscillospiraceae bacterium]|nr:helix-turn-helix transcriptional regulator [Oscillospiraceae bacterium]
MDQIQIGKFIAACRKEKGMTQAQLAEKMGISDRAVSKWETGKNMPDSSIMLELCDELGITVNDLLNGRRIAMENYKEIAEKTILEMQNAKEQNDKLLLLTEIVISIPSVLIMLILCMVAAYAQIPEWVRIVLIAVGVIQLIPCVLVSLGIEQRAGYYMCKKCGHRWVPAYAQVFFAPHFGRTRKMTCPYCGKRCYHKKVIKK